MLLLACWTGSVNATRVRAQPPPLGGAEIAHIIAAYTPAEASANHMMRPLNDTNTVVYEQSFRGGGIGLGVLLGPLGVAAIKARTEARYAPTRRGLRCESAWPMIFSAWLILCGGILR